MISITFLSQDASNSPDEEAGLTGEVSNQRDDEKPTSTKPPSIKDDIEMNNASSPSAGGESIGAGSIRSGDDEEDGLLSDVKPSSIKDNIEMINASSPSAASKSIDDGHISSCDHEEVGLPRQQSQGGEATSPVTEQKVYGVLADVLIPSENDEQNKREPYTNPPPEVASSPNTGGAALISEQIQEEKRSPELSEV